MRSDYDRILKQRNTLLKTAGHRPRRVPRDRALDPGRVGPAAGRVGAELLAARLRLVDDLRPYVGKAYEAVARGASRDDAEIDYKPSFELEGADRGRPT